MSQQDSGFSTPISRRVVLKGGASIMLSAMLPFAVREAAASRTALPSFLSEAEVKTLAAVVDRMIPADHEPGGLAANCARFIDAFLGAFQSDPPFIYAGGPFSNRAGHPENQFLEFVPLDFYEETAWRLLLEGSGGNAALEFNGPVIGLQQIYRDGLAALDARAQQFGVSSFAEIPAPAQDLLLRDPESDAVARLLDAAYLDTMNGMYGPPEYGGNEALAGWKNTGYDGDVQPRGYSDEQVINADNASPFDALLPPSYSETVPRQAPVKAQRARISHEQALQIASQLPVPDLPFAPVTSQEVMSAVVADAEGSLERLRQILKPYADSLQGGQ